MNYYLVHIKNSDIFLNSIQQPTQAAIHEIAYDCLVPLRQEYSRENGKNIAKWNYSQMEEKYCSENAEQM